MTILPTMLPAIGEAVRSPTALFAQDGGPDFEWSPGSGAGLHPDLDHSRASSAWAVVNGYLVEYGPDRMRPYGWMEEQASNEQRNNKATGSTNGVIGAGGVPPTDWLFFENATGLSREIVGAGAENGMPYLDFRWFGTATAGPVEQRQMQNTNAVAAPGENWTQSQYIRLMAGTLENVVELKMVVQDRNGTGAQINGSGDTFLPTNAPLLTQRHRHTRTAGAGTAFITGGVRILVDNGPVDFTLRIGGMTFENRSWASSVVLTDPGAANTRAKDVMTMTGQTFADMFNPEQGVIEADAQLIGIPDLTGFPKVVQMDDGSTANRLAIFHVSALSELRAAVASGGSQFFPNDTLDVGPLPFKSGLEYSAEFGAFVVNGQLVASGGPLTLPVGVNAMAISGTSFNTAAANLIVDAIRYRAARLAIGGA